MTDTIDPRARILRALSSMPYGAAATFRLLGGRSRSGADRYDDVTFDAVADDLERLRDVLRGVGDRDQQRDSELWRLRGWVSSVRGIAEEATRLAEQAPEPPHDPATAEEVPAP